MNCPAPWKIANWADAFVVTSIALCVTVIICAIFWFNGKT